MKNQPALDDGQGWVSLLVDLIAVRLSSSQVIKSPYFWAVYMLLSAVCLLCLSSGVYVALPCQALI